MMRVFDWPWMTVLSVVAGAAMAAGVLMSFRRRIERLARFGARDLVTRLVPAAAIGRPTWRAARLAAVMVFALLALAGPRWGRERSIVQGEGIDIVLALDASSSMEAPDFFPTRYEAAKEVAAAFIADRRDDRIGLVVFSGEALTAAPLTLDHDYVLRVLAPPRSEMTTGMADGTAIGTALATAAARLRPAPGDDPRRGLAGRRPRRPLGFVAGVARQAARRRRTAAGPFPSQPSVRRQSPRLPVRQDRGVGRARSTAGGRHRVCRDDAAGQA